MLYGLKRSQHQPLPGEARGDSRVPVLSQPSGLWVQIGYSHLDLEENGGDAVTREPTVGSEEVHTDRPPSCNVTTTSLDSNIILSTCPHEE